MGCRLCKFLEQYVYNWLHLLDYMANTLLLGRPNETMSVRSARARDAGNKFAASFCNLLTKAIKIGSRGRITEDHCDYAIDHLTPPISKEIWDWNTGKIITMQSRSPNNNIELDNTTNLEKNNL